MLKPVADLNKNTFFILQRKLILFEVYPSSPSDRLTTLGEIKAQINEK